MQKLKHTIPSLPNIKDLELLNEDNQSQIFGGISVAADSPDPDSKKNDVESISGDSYKKD